MQKSFYSSAVSVNNIISATKLSDLTDTNIVTPSNNQILQFSGSKWINANNPSAAVSSVFTRTGAIVANSGDYNISQITNNSYLASDVNLTVSTPTAGQTIRYDGTKYLNSKLSMDDLSNTNIISPAEADSLIYSSAGLGTWKNQKKYAELFDYVNISPGSTVTAVGKTVYFCNLATINFGAETTGSIVKVINTNGPLLTINFPGIILYFNTNNFNTTLTTTDACEIVFEKILGNSWQVLSFTGKILNSVTGKNLANNDLNDLRNVVITSPNVGQVISYNGSNFVNSTLPTIPVSSVFGRTGAVVATEGDYNLNLLSDVTITSPIIGQTLLYDGLNFINSRRVDSFQYNSDSNLSNGNFLYQGYGQNASENRTQVLLPYNITLTEFNINLTVAPGTGKSRFFTIRTNGNIQVSITIANLATTLTQSINVACTAGQLLSIQGISVGAAAALGIFNLKYFYN